MELTEFNNDMDIIYSLHDTPSQTATELKQKFDQSGKEIQSYLNETLIVELNAAIATIPPVINDLTTGGANDAASAETVKTLNTQKQDAIAYGTSAPSGGSDGDIYLRYS